MMTDDKIRQQIHATIARVLPGIASLYARAQEINDARGVFAVADGFVKLDAVRRINATHAELADAIMHALSEMLVVQCAVAADQWASAAKDADALIDKSLDLVKQRRVFDARAEPFGPSLAANETKKIQREIDALEPGIMKACEIASARERDWIEIANLLHAKAQEEGAPQPTKATPP